MRLQGKTALITAAGQGIGRASALALACAGGAWAGVRRGAGGQARRRQQIRTFERLPFLHRTGPTATGQGQQATDQGRRKTTKRTLHSLLTR